MTDYEYDKLYDIVESLDNNDLNCIDINELKKKLLSEYSQRVGLSINIKMLQMKFNDPDELRRNLKDSSCTDENEPGLNTLLSNSTRVFLISLFLSDNRKMKELREKIASDYNWDDLKMQFEKDIAFSSTNDAFSWMNEHMTKIVMINVSESWKKMHVYMDDFAYYFWLNIFTEIIKNLFKHSDLSQKITFDFYEENDDLVFEVKNKIGTGVKVRSSGKGIKALSSTSYTC